MQKLPVVLAAVGLAFLLIGVLAGWVIVPKVIEDQITKQVQIRNGTETYDKWKDIPLPVYLKFYIFNVTNPKDVEKGEKPIFQEVGPYVYRETRRKEISSVSEDEEIITYRQKIDYFFEEKLSEGSEDDLVTIINIPFVTVATMLSKINPRVANLVISILQTLSLRTESMIRKNIRLGDLTFKGFPVPFYAVPLQIITNLAPILGIEVPALPPEFGGGRFGFYNGKNGSDDGVYEIHSGVGDTSKFGVIKTWNNKTELDFWVQSPGDYCNMINGSDGSIFPPFVKKDRVLRLFNADLCRSLYLTYDQDVEFMGIPGMRFTAPRSMLEDPQINHDNLCFCPSSANGDFSGCLKSGAIQLSSCRDGAPVAMSTPHFYDASEEYLNQSIGLRPQQERHETFIELEPNTGLPLQASKRIQINVELQKMSDIVAFQNVPEMLFPVLWADEFAALDEENANELKRQLITPLKIVGIAKWTILGISYLLIGAGAAICAVRMRGKRKHLYNS